MYFAADHAGFPLKQALIPAVQAAGYDVEDCGATELDMGDDYPEIIARAARKLSEDAKGGLDSRAIVIGASGQGEAMVANRFRGVRCALYYSAAAKAQTDVSGKQLDMLSSTREHNNANALSLGARFLDTEEASRTVLEWLKKPFSGEERHARRVQGIDSVA